MQKKKNYVNWKSLLSIKSWSLINSKKKIKCRILSCVLEFYYKISRHWNYFTETRYGQLTKNSKLQACNMTTWNLCKRINVHHKWWVNSLWNLCKKGNGFITENAEEKLKILMCTFSSYCACNNSNKRSLLER